MSHYKSNVRDIEFNLFEMLDTEKVLETGKFRASTPTPSR